MSGVRRMMVYQYVALWYLMLKIQFYFRCPKNDGVPKGCYMVPDPKDPLCCQIPDCSFALPDIFSTPSNRITKVRMLFTSVLMLWPLWIIKGVHVQSKSLKYHSNYGKNYFLQNFEPSHSFSVAASAISLHLFILI